MFFNAIAVIAYLAVFAAAATPEEQRNWINDNCNGGKASCCSPTTGKGGSGNNVNAGLNCSPVDVSFLAGGAVNPTSYCDGTVCCNVQQKGVVNVACMDRIV